MPYVGEISRQNPSCFLFLIDQSGSMSDPCGDDSGKSKAQKLADAVNRLLANLIIRCTKNEKEGVQNYYEVGVIGYGAKVGPAWLGPLAADSKTLIPLRVVADNHGRIEERTRKVEDGAGGLVDETVRFYVWIEPLADNGTPMCAAFDSALATLEPWVNAHPVSFPPIVINITDGESTDGDFRPAAERIRALNTDDGQVLLFNIHLSARAGSQVLYCEDGSSLPDEFSKMLFESSSVLPPHIQDAAKQEGFPIGPASRGFAFNADIVEVIKFLDIGTRAKLR